MVPSRRHASLFRKVSVLYASMTLSLVFGVINSMTTSRLLTISDFGYFRISQNVLSVLAIACSLGVFTTGGTVLARSRHPHEESAVIAALAMLTAAATMLMTAMVLAGSSMAGRVFGSPLQLALVASAPLLVGFQLQLVLTEVLRGLNRIVSLSLTSVAPQATYLVVSVSLMEMHETSSLSAVMALYTASLALPLIAISLRLQPSWQRVREGFLSIYASHSSVGAEVYVASLLGACLAYAGSLSLGYFSTSEAVALFSLATTVSLPLSLVPNAVASAAFRDFAGMGQISSVTVWMSGILSLLALALFLGGIGPLMELLYPKGYAGAIGPARVLAVAAVIHGAGDFYNRFLLAHGRGKELKRSSIALAAVGVVLYSSLTIAWHLSGALAARIMVSTVYFVTMRWYYGKVRRATESTARS